MDEIQLPAWLWPRARHSIARHPASQQPEMVASLEAERKPIPGLVWNGWPVSEAPRGLARYRVLAAHFITGKIEKPPEELEDEIHNIARQLLYDVKLFLKSPKFMDVQKSLSELMLHIHGIKSAIQGLDPFIFSWIETALAPLPTGKHFFPPFTDENTDNEASKFMRALRHNPSSLTILDALEKIVQQEIQECSELGGQSHLNYYERRFGDPRRDMTKSCGELILKAQGASAVQPDSDHRTPDETILAEVCRDVIQYAFGDPAVRDIRENNKLENPVWVSDIAKALPELENGGLIAKSIIIRALPALSPHPSSELMESTERQAKRLEDRYTELTNMILGRKQRPKSRKKQ